jgi:MoaA/NifB/PqqE/SkfB family radical SAM enzyme
MSNPTTKFDFNDRPFIVIWEVTRACSLACRHCRAKANSRRHPLELATEESFRFIEQVERARPTLFIMTGGDPIRRFDLEDLVRYATDRGLHVSISPSATPEFVSTDLAKFKDAGLQRISLSLDGASAETHDRFRGVRGTWNLTMEAIANAALAGIPVQINTTFTRHNLSEFDDFVRLMDEIRPAVWSVFQLVPTGRGKVGDLLTAEELENLFERLAKLSLAAPYDIKTTEGRH